MGHSVMRPRLSRRLNAISSAAQAPVIDAHLVPPSASITSQSTCRVTGGSLRRSTTARRALPTSLWISEVLPESLPFTASRSPRVPVALGIIWYSAVIQPPGTPWAFIQEGTFSSRETAHTTLVPPHAASTEPSGWDWKLGTKASGLSWSGRRPSCRGMGKISLFGLIFLEKFAPSLEITHGGSYIKTTTPPAGDALNIPQHRRGNGHAGLRKTP